MEIKRGQPENLDLFNEYIIRYNTITLPHILSLLLLLYKHLSTTFTTFSHEIERIGGGGTGEDACVAFAELVEEAFGPLKQVNEG